MNTVLQSTQLNKTYNLDPTNRHHVLYDVNLEIRRGDFVAVMGPSGSGKSTLLYNLSGMDRATSGSVVFKNYVLNELSERQLARIRLCEMGFVFQHIHLLKNLSILDNVLLSGLLSKRLSRRATHDRARALMERTGIADLADRTITQASGGQLQRVGICRALINDPDIIFGDEPTGALNSKASGEIMDLLAEVNRGGTTVLLVTHDVRVAARANRVLLMKDGYLVSEKELGTAPDDAPGRLDREEALANWLLEMEV